MELYGCINSPQFKKCSAAREPAARIRYNPQIFIGLSSILAPKFRIPIGDTFPAKG